MSIELGIECFLRDGSAAGQRVGLLTNYETEA